MNRTSKLQRRTAGWIRSNADELEQLPHPSESPWNTEETDITNAEINLWRSKGVIRKDSRNDDGVRCDWITPQKVWNEFERSVNKYGYDDDLTDR